MFSGKRQRSGSTTGVVELDMTAETSDAATSVTEAPASHSLDDLLSPTTEQRPLEADAEKRDSVVDSGVVVDLEDDVRFSNVPLSAKESHKSLASSLLDRRSTVSFGKKSRSNTVSSLKGHRKSASAHTVGSSSPRASEQFLLQRLEHSKSMDDSSDAKRLSASGQQRIQEEFSKLQNGHTSKPPRADSSSDEDESSIDWGSSVPHWQRSSGLWRADVPFSRFLGECYSW